MKLLILIFLLIALGFACDLDVISIDSSIVNCTLVNATQDDLTLMRGDLICDHQNDTSLSVDLLDCDPVGESGKQDCGVDGMEYRIDFNCIVPPSPAPTPTPSPGSSPTPSPTPSSTPSNGTSPTPSNSTSPTPSNSTSPTPSNSTSPTPTPVPTPSPTPTPTPMNPSPAPTTPVAPSTTPPSSIPTMDVNTGETDEEGIRFWLMVGLLCLILLVLLGIGLFLFIRSRRYRD